MSDTQQPASAGEMIVYQGKLHWAIFVRPVMFTCLALTLFNYNEPLYGAAAMIVAGLFWAATLMAVAGSLFVITERRILIRSGTVYRVDLDLPLEQVDAVTVRQDTMGRLLGYGTLVVDGRDGSRATCATVAHADRFGQQLRTLRGAA
ncbi:MAG: PH domain-containing protein [Chloroflexales bacterium]|nr:PH domain-containing protein [Chloroflexales bacterium]